MRKALSKQLGHRGRYRGEVSRFGTKRAFRGPDLPDRVSRQHHRCQQYLTVGQIVELARRGGCPDAISRLRHNPRRIEVIEPAMKTPKNC